MQLDQDRANLPFERRQLALYDLPHALTPDSVVPVHDKVPEVDDDAPRNLRMPRAQLCRNAVRGLADDLQPVERCRLQGDVGREVVGAARAVLTDELDALDDVEQRVLVATQSGTASASTNSRSRGLTCSPTSTLQPRRSSSST